MTSRRFALAFVAVLGLALGGWCIGQHGQSSFLHTDGLAYATMNRAIAEHGDLDVGRYEKVRARTRHVSHGISSVALGADGRWRPKHSFLMPVASTPFYLAFGVPGLLLFDVLAAIAALALVQRFAARFAGDVPAALATLALATSPIVLEQVHGYSHDTLCTLLVAVALVATSERRMALAGLFAGLALWAKPTLVGVLLPTTIALLLVERAPAGAARSWLGLSSRAWARGAIGLAVPTIAHAASNTYLFGAPWITSYDRVIAVRRGVVTIDPVSAHWGKPIGETLEGLLLGQRGFAGQMPMALAGVVGLLLLLRGRQRGVALGGLASTLAFLAIFCTYEWPLARYAVPWLPVLALGLAALVGTLAGIVPSPEGPPAPDERRENRVILVGLAVVVALAGTSAVLAWAHEPATRLSARLATASAQVGDETCSFFDLSNDHLACTRRSDDRHRPAGRAGRGRCRAAGVLGPLVLITPEGFRSPATTVTWPDLPRGRSPHLLLATERRHPGAPPSVIELRANGRSIGTYSIAGDERFRREALPDDLLAHPPTTLEIEVRGSSSTACVDLRWAR
ncbi:MAG: glycosyltransferase family 39 protein [Deltaproteobacteria bacterium]|nr:glycosyltransferase family 39 protein [Deltaproteobacteria bacterium]